MSKKSEAPPKKRWKSSRKCEENTLDRISDHSFLQMENLCDQTFQIGQKVEKDLLQDVKIPEFDDTLEEVEFILSLGLQLKAEGKTNFPTPVSNLSKTSERCLSVEMETKAESSPRTSFIPSTIARKRLSKVISPIMPRESSSPFTTCRSNISQFPMMSPSPSTVNHKFQF